MKIGNIVLIAVGIAGVVFLMKKAKDKQEETVVADTTSKGQILTDQEVTHDVDTDPIVQAEMEQLGSNQGLALVEPMSANGSRGWDSDNL
jgi:hypothetical protein